MKARTALVLLLIMSACSTRSPRQDAPQFVAMNLAAHPDDEDGATMHYLRHARNIAVHSVIFTRGEGGQNEIGPELYEALGAIRSAETEAAARHLGTQVHFLNFKDFGYSKTATETFARWGGRDSVIAELVYMIRRLKPDIVFTNHDTVITGPRRQHGHHQVVGLAAYDAFALSADSTYHPDQLLEPGADLWQPARLFLRRFGGGGAYDAGLPVGDIHAATGESFASGAAEALGFHASQGMDQIAARVRQLDTMRFSMLRASDPVSLPLTDLYHGLSPRADRSFDMPYLIDSGRTETASLISDDSIAVPGQALVLSWGNLPADGLRWEFSGALDTTVWLREPGIRLHVPENAVLTRPARVFQYFRRVNHPPIVYAAYDGTGRQPVVAGYLPVEIAAPLHIESRRPSVRLHPGINEIPLQVHVFDRGLQNATIEATVMVDGRVLSDNVLEMALGGRGITGGIIPVSMPAVLPGADFEIILDGGTNQERLEGRAFDAVVAPGLRLGLIASYDDTMEEALRELGVDYVLVDLSEPQMDDLHTIVIDIRGYLVREDLRAHNQELLDWVRGGGHLVVSYHKTFEWNEAGWAPFPLELGRARVSEEDAVVTVKAPAQPLMTWPNVLGSEVWEGWVQERGLYFPQEWDDRYEELFCMADTGEPSHCGSTLLASVGDGTYLYTALAWYRQLGNHHAGALSAFANFISLPLYNE